MELKYETYNFTPILGWSNSRYELFDKCKRGYFYTYYSKYVPDVAAYKIDILKNLTSVALEVGNIIHEVIEAFLYRLQKSDSAIDEKRFFSFARAKTEEFFAKKTFLETYYHTCEAIDQDAALKKIDTCLSNFLTSPIYTWIFMKAMTNKQNWMIEPKGYGETRLQGIKAYCKMDFLFPVDDSVYILDWKTGKKDAVKHKTQLIGYAAAAANNFNLTVQTISPKIIYLWPQYDEYEITLSSSLFDEFFEKVQLQTTAMLALCVDSQKNIPLPIDRFPMQPSAGTCKFCNYQELCFKGNKGYPSLSEVSLDEQQHG
ncbi:MAG: PD-(D/E)XK nuclease family protein [Chitinivibrionales bacterium]|nr:PD-(D/E)XK nuclease family protein [Chitinivibrionales bacterium]